MEVLSTHPRVSRISSPVLIFRPHFDMINHPSSLSASLAQLAEQLTLNQRVVGSSPTGGTSDRSRQTTTGTV